jgi:hypothetical protein
MRSSAAPSGGQGAGELKYDEIESAILRRQDLLAEFNHLEQKARLRTLGKLERLGVLPADDDLCL